MCESFKNISVPRLTCAFCLALICCPGFARPELGKPRVIRERIGIVLIHAQYPRFRNASAVERLAGWTFKTDALKAIDAFKQEAADRQDLAYEMHVNLETDYKVHLTYVSKALVSGFSHEDGYLAGAHGYTILRPRTIGIRAGKPSMLVLRDLLLPEKEPAELCRTLVLQGVNAQKQKGFLKQESFPTEMINSFVVTPNGLKWTIPPYQMGAYAEGSFYVLVPWSKLQGWVNPEGPLKRLGQERVLPIQPVAPGDRQE